MFKWMKRLLGRPEAATGAVLGFQFLIENEGLGLHFQGAPSEILQAMRNERVRADEFTQHEMTEISVAAVRHERQVGAASDDERLARIIAELSTALGAADRERSVGLLDEHRELLESRDDVRWHLLVECSLEGRADSIRMLLERGVEHDGSGSFEMTALHWSAAYGHADATEVLIRAGADPCRLNSLFFEPADLAAANGHHELAQTLVEAAGVAEDGALGTHERVLLRMAAQADDPGAGWAEDGHAEMSEQEREDLLEIAAGVVRGERPESDLEDSGITLGDPVSGEDAKKQLLAELDALGDEDDG